MLKSLKLQGIGPVSNLAAQFGNRLNVLTGDNGLGKSFLLDVCFWALTGTWPGGRTAIPESAGTVNPAPSISFELATGRAKSRTAEYIYQSQAWATEAWAPAPALVLYAAVDGSFSVWDYARNDWPTSLLRARGLRLSKEKPEPLAYQFSPEAVAEGLKDDDRVLCNGLIQDWVTWYYQRSSNGSDNPFHNIEAVVAALAHPEEPLRVAPTAALGVPSRVFQARTVAPDSLGNTSKNMSLAPGHLC